MRKLASGDTKHGPFAREYQRWTDMKTRCYNARSSHYRHYGGRGITVCDRWRTKFENFLLDVGIMPSIHHQIDRIDNDRGYEPGNCRWATRIEQARNRRNVVKVDGRSLSEWAEVLNLSVKLLSARYLKGDRPPQLFRMPRRGKPTHCKNGHLLERTGRVEQTPRGPRRRCTLCKFKYDVARRQKARGLIPAEDVWEGEDE